MSTTPSNPGPKSPNKAPNSTKSEEAEAGSAMQRQPATSEKEKEPSTPAKERKKPRKLLRSTPSSPAVAKAFEDVVVASTETSLDERVQALEQRYQSITKRLDTNAKEIGKLQASSRSSRKSSTTRSKDTNLDIPLKKQEPVQTTIPPPEHKQQQRIEELPDDEEEDIETIPRLDGTAQVEQRSVALTGNYKIPLPSTLSTDDVKAIQSGLAAAGSVAREITAAIRTNAQQVQTQAQHGGEVSGQGDKALSTEVADPSKSPKSWSAFLSDCSKLVAKAVEVDAAVEATRGKKSASTTSSPSTSKTSSKAYQNATKSSAARKHEKSLSDVSIGDGKKHAPKASTGSVNAVKGESVPLKAS